MPRRTHPDVILPPPGRFLPRHPSVWPDERIVQALNIGRSGGTVVDAAAATGATVRQVSAMLSRRGLLVGTFRPRRDA